MQVDNILVSYIRTQKVGQKTKTSSTAEQCDAAIRIADPKNERMYKVIEAGGNWRTIERTH